MAGGTERRTQDAELVPTSEALDDPLEDPESYALRVRASEERQALKRLPYDPRIAAIIIARVAGGETLKRVCESYGISFGTIHKWKRTGPHSREFKEALREAEELGAQYKVEEAVELSDAPMSFPVDAMKAKLQTDMRWKLAEKHAPGKYGKAAEEGGGMDWGKVLDKINERRKGPGGAPSPAVQVPGQVVPRETGKDPI